MSPASVTVACPTCDDPIKLPVTLAKGETVGNRVIVNVGVDKGGSAEAVAAHVVRNFGLHPGWHG